MGCLQSKKQGGKSGVESTGLDLGYRAAGPFEVEHAQNRGKESNDRWQYNDPDINPRQHPPVAGTIFTKVVSLAPARKPINRGQLGNPQSEVITKRKVIEEIIITIVEMGLAEILFDDGLGYGVGQ